MDVEEAAEFGGKFRYEPDISVRNNLVRDAIVGNNVTGVEEGNSF
jgi:hypothetical protein